LTQEEAGQFMGVSRGTIQRIVSTARKKLATALSEGKAIVFVDDEEPESESEPQQEPEGH
jgi:predicted DNA-binding protein (UPF0251 family)